MSCFVDGCGFTAVIVDGERVFRDVAEVASCFSSGCTSSFVLVHEWPAVKRSSVDAKQEDARTKKSSSLGKENRLPPDARTSPWAAINRLKRKTKKAPTP